MPQGRLGFRAPRSALGSPWSALCPLDTPGGPPHGHPLRWGRLSRPRTDTQPPDPDQNRPAGPPKPDFGPTPSASRPRLPAKPQHYQPWPRGTTRSPIWSAAEVKAPTTYHGGTMPRVRQCLHRRSYLPWNRLPYPRLFGTAPDQRTARSEGAILSARRGPAPAASLPGPDARELRDLTWAGGAGIR